MSEPPVTMEILRRMMQRMLDQQEHERLEMQIMKRELKRIDRRLSALEHRDLDRADFEDAIETRFAHLARRVDRLEDT
jgi:hypothetical protein